jgi:spore coat polysaccharide biosynthesis predicted glycosyltransferase SpsG
LNSILVTFGGGVAAGAHDAFLDAAELLAERLPATTLLISQNHPARDLMFERAARLPAVTARLTSDNFTSFVEASDLAVSAAGATLWELASLGVPSLALVIAENQEPLAQHLQSCGAGVSLGQLSNATPTLIASHIDRLINHSESLAAMSLAALGLVDGHGSQRVCDALSTSL